MKHQPVILLILDGWGIRQDSKGNAILQAHPQHYLNLLERYPCVALNAAGEAVGLPDNQMGNSEVGHLNMGAGRIVYQELTRISKSIRDGDFFRNEVLLQGMHHAIRQNSTLHLMGLVSDGGVHSCLGHLMALLEMAKRENVPEVRVHAFLDGRDVPPKSAGEYLHAVEQKLLALDYPPISTISGRYYAMDRDNRWERTQKAYDNLLMATGRRFLLSQDALEYAYNQGETDEFVSPAVTDITFGGMQDGDSIIFFNFRPDRARQLTRAFIEPDFHAFERQKTLQNFSFVSMCMVDESLNAPIAFPKQPLNRILSEVLSENGIRQFRTAETEKYAHVTYFLNGGFETPYPREDRKLIPSPKVATYDLQPEMSLPSVCRQIIEALDSGRYQFIASNFANPDMVGHTGKMDAALLAVKAVDECIGKVAQAALRNGWVLLLTSDHGNIETMIDEDGGPHTAHTTNPVPLILVSDRDDLILDESKTYPISCIAPTVLDIMGLPLPPEMTTGSILLRAQSRLAR